MRHTGHSDGTQRTAQRGGLRALRGPLRPLWSSFRPPPRDAPGRHARFCRRLCSRVADHGPALSPLEGSLHSRTDQTFRPASSAFNRVSPVECTDTKNAPVSLLDSTDTKSLDLKSFRIRSYKKYRGGPPPCLLPFASCLLPFAFCLLPFASYLLPFAFYFNSEVHNVRKTPAR